MRVSPWLLLVLSGCASSTGGSPASSPAPAAPPPSTQTVRIAGGAGTALTMTVTSDNRTAIVGTLQRPIERVWAVLPAVFDSLGIAANAVDAPSFSITRSNLKARRRLKNIPLVRLLDCGTAQGSASAETYELTISVTTRLERHESGGTTVATLLDASGRPVTFSGDPVKCTSKTALEQRIFDLAAALSAP